MNGSAAPHFISSSRKQMSSPTTVISAPYFLARAAVVATACPIRESSEQLTCGQA